MIGSRARRSVVSLAATLALLLAALPFVAQVPAARAQEGAAAEVRVVDFAFEPGTITVAVGATVTWTNAGDAPHTVTADDGAFDSGRLDPGESFSQTFGEPGTYAYFCAFHPQMVGTIVVAGAQARDLGEATPAPEAAVEREGAPAAETAAGEEQNLTPVDTPHLAHVHAGTCEELGIVVYSLSGLRGYRIEPNGGDAGAVETIVGTANVPLADLFNEPFSIHVHQSAQDKQIYLACADVGTQPDAPWTEADGLALRLKTQNDSGYFGFASLVPSADGGTSITLALAAPSAAEQAAGAQPAPPRGTTYTSPTFGYAITYGPTWRVTEDVSGGGRDRFVLFNGTSYITFTGAEGFGGDPARCVESFVETLTADPNVSNLGLATDENGEPLQGGTEATGAYAVYNHDYTFPDRVEAYTLFVGCIPLVPNEAVLAVVQNVPTAQYNDQVAAREALLRGLALNQ